MTLLQAECASKILGRSLDSALPFHLSGDTPKNTRPSDIRGQRAILQTVERDYNTCALRITALHTLLEQAKEKEKELETLRRKTINKINTALRKKKKLPIFPNEIWGQIFGLTLLPRCHISKESVKSVGGYLFDSEFHVFCGNFHTPTLRTLLNSSAPSKLTVSVGGHDDAEKSAKQFLIALQHGSRWSALTVSGLPHTPCELFKTASKAPKITALHLPTLHILCFSGHISHLLLLDVTISTPENITKDLPILLKQTPLLNTLLITTNDTFTPGGLADCYSDIHLPELTTFHPSFNWSGEEVEFVGEFISCIAKCTRKLRSLVLEFERDDRPVPSKEQALKLLEICDRRFSSLQELKFLIACDLSEVEPWILHFLTPSNKSRSFPKINRLSIKLEDSLNNWHLLKTLVQKRHFEQGVSRLNTLEVKCDVDVARELDTVHILQVYVPNLTLTYFPKSKPESPQYPHQPHFHMPFMGDGLGPIPFAHTTFGMI